MSAFSFDCKKFKSKSPNRFVQFLFRQLLFCFFTPLELFWGRDRCEQVTGEPCLVGACSWSIGKTEVKLDVTIVNSFAFLAVIRPFLDTLTVPSAPLAYQFLDGLTKLLAAFISVVHVVTEWHTAHILADMVERSLDNHVWIVGGDVGTADDWARRVVGAIIVDDVGMSLPHLLG